MHSKILIAFHTITRPLTKLETRFEKEVPSLKHLLSCNFAAISVTNQSNQNAINSVSFGFRAAFQLIGRSSRCIDTRRRPIG